MTTQGTHGEPDLLRFSRFVKARRAALGLTQEEVSALGGPSDTTFTKIENLDWKPGRAGTLKKLDAGLRWQEGSSARILYEGGDPIPLDTAAAESSVRRSAAELAIELTILIEAGLQSAWSVLDAQDPRARRTIAELDGAAQVAETLALQLADSGEDFARQRRQMRERIRGRSGGIYSDVDPIPADPSRDWQFRSPSAESVAIARAAAETDETG